MKEKKHLKIIWPVSIAITLILISAGIFMLTTYNRLLSRKIKDLSATVNYLKSETMFARVKINSLENNKIKAVLTFFTPEKKIALQKKINISGQDLYIESTILIIRDQDVTRALIFPSVIYSDRIAPSQGIILTELYPSSGKLPLYQPSKSDSSIESQISTLYKVAMGNTNVIKQDKIINRFNTSVHLGPFNHFKVNESYLLTLYPNGAVEIKQKH